MRKLHTLAGTIFILSCCGCVPKVRAQVSNPSIIAVSAAPTGSCTNGLPAQLVVSTGTIYSCQAGTWGAIGGSGTFNALTGDATSTATGGATTVVGLNGTLLSGLATGLMTITTATGVPGSVAAPAGAVVGTTDTQTLTNKTIDGVTPTTMSYVDPTSSIQTQLNAKAPSLGNATVLTSSTTLACSSTYVANSASALTETLPAIATGCVGSMVNINTATATYSSATTIYCTTGGATTSGTTCAVPAGDTSGFKTDGTSWYITVVPTSTGAAIASGTATLGTAAISSGACATVVTVAATGVLTTDRIVYTPNTDPTAVTGYAPSATGSLYIWAYPTAGNVNFKACNNTSGSITPAALTLNWSVNR